MWSLVAVPWKQWVDKIRPLLQNMVNQSKGCSWTNSDNGKEKNFERTREWKYQYYKKILMIIEICVPKLAVTGSWSKFMLHAVLLKQIVQGWIPVSAIPHTVILIFLIYWLWLSCITVGMTISIYVCIRHWPNSTVIVVIVVILIY